MSAFITPDDHILIMDMFDHMLTLDELRMLEDAGIKTVYAQGMVRWNLIMTGVNTYDWTYLDNYIEKLSKTNLKVILPNSYILPTFYPDDWYFSRVGGGIPNYSSPKVMTDVDRLDVMLMERYGKNKVQVIYSIPCNGEFVEGIYPTLIHPIPNDVIVPFVVGRISFLQSQYNEVWTSYHPNGYPPYMDAIYGALKDAFPNAQHYVICFTYFCQPAEINMYDKVQHMRNNFGLHFFTGSEYCEGLRANTDACINLKMKFLCAPIHPFRGDSGRLELWMLDAIRASLAKFNQAQHV